jgi:hypothetical protein
MDECMFDGKPQNNTIDWDRIKNILDAAGADMMQNFSNVKDSLADFERIACGLPKAKPTDECDDASCSACVPQSTSQQSVRGFDEMYWDAARAYAHAHPTPKADSAQAAEMLTRSADLLVERGKRYDKADGTSSMDRAVAALNTITGHNLTEDEGWMLMLLLKLSRATAKAGYHADSYEDAAAFVGLMAVARSKREEGK